MKSYCEYCERVIDVDLELDLHRRQQCPFCKAYQRKPHFSLEEWVIYLYEEVKKLKEL
jgi:hypothetical protein